MKAKFIMALGLASVFSLTACVDQMDVNPNFDPVTKTVKTNFVFTIASAAGSTPETKQSSAIVQKTGHFRGIDDATLYTFALLDADGKYADGQKIVDVPLALKATDMLRMNKALLPEYISDELDDKDNGGTRILQVNLTEGINTVLFYGKAARTTKTESGRNLSEQQMDEINGRLIYGGVDQDGKETDNIVLEYPGRIYSYPKPRLQDTTALKDIQGLVIGVLNGLTHLGINGTDENDKFNYIEVGELSESGMTIVPPKIYWKTYGDAVTQTNPKSPAKGTTDLQELERMLGLAYNELTNIRKTTTAQSEEVEKRSGSGPSLARQMSDLYNIFVAGSTATPYDPVELVAKKISQLGKAYLEKFFSPVQDPQTQMYELTWKDPLTEVLQALRTYGLNPNTNFGDYTIQNYPENFNLPLGAVTLLQDEEVTSFFEFKYNSDEGLGVKEGPLTKYTYAPELCYYCNSYIRISEDPAVNPTGSFPSYSTWLSSDWQKSSGEGGINVSWLNKKHVTSKTQGVAVYYPVEYGMALFRTEIKNPSGDEIVMYDNNQKFNPNEQPKSFTLSNTSYLEWTGILIGGQPGRADWQYMLRDGASLSNIVYDKINYQVDDDGNATWGERLPITPEALSRANYTVLYDSYNPKKADDQQETILVALEFVNHLGSDFWGKDNMIRNGGTFYLLAEMKTNVSFNKWKEKDKCMMPPYYKTTDETHEKGETKRVYRVFMQDFMTTAQFLLASDSLKKAYVSVPDLRSTNLSLGLAVNLDWDTGHSYALSFK